MKKTALLLATLDTKGQEALFLKSVLERLGVGVLILDAGIFPSPVGEGDIKRHEVAMAGGRAVDELIRAGNKGEAISTMISGAVALTRRLYDEGRIHGALSIGGAQGTIIGTTAMRSLPLGVPKIMLSTMASGRRIFETYVGTSDVTLIHSVVDFFGLNSVLRQMLSNAAGALAGMLQTSTPTDATTASVGDPAGPVRASDRPQVAITIYGTTTPAGMRIVSLLQKKCYEAVAFHPNGVGGRAMEEMIAQGRFAGVIDLTLHELIDEIAGGQHAAGPNRLEAAARMGIPQVVVPGSTDYIVTGRFSELKKSFRQRTTMMHNPEMTFVMPSEREMAKLGEIVARKLNPTAGRGNTVVMVPLKGFCYPNFEGRPLYNPGGVRAFVAALQKRIKPSIPLRLLPLHVNDEAFADAVVEEFETLMRTVTPTNVQAASVGAKVASLQNRKE
jgi:uncharacterized protein (UPF0261 family)